jgi:aminoacrylate hydrolase
MAAEWDRQAVIAAFSLFLFSPRYTRENPEKLQEWIESAAARSTGPNDHEIALKRIDMIAAHDTLPRLGGIQHPTLVLCGDHNFCTPLPLSEEIAQTVPGAELVVFEDAGELIEIEQAERYFNVVRDWIGRHGDRIGR